MADVKTPKELDELLKSARMTPGSTQGEAFARNETPRPPTAPLIVPTVKAESVFTSSVTVARTLETAEPEVFRSNRTTTYGEWDRLHDATIDLLTFDWAAGIIRITLLLSRLPLITGEITVHGTKLLRWPRQQPWGPSVSVNEARLSEGRLDLNIQSGDVVEIDGARFELRIDG